MKPLAIIQSLWIGGSLSTMEQLCICSFLHHGHPFHLYTYGDVENIPEGVVVKDAGAIIPADKIFKYKAHNSYAGFANLFRYKLLFEKGNYWVDTDMVCLKPLRSDKEHHFAAQQIMPEDGHWGRIRAVFNRTRNAIFETSNSPQKHKHKEKVQMVNSCLIKAPQHSELLLYCYRQAAGKDPAELTWGQTGPKLLTAAVRKFDMWDSVAKPNVFCCFNWWEWERLLGMSQISDLPAEAQAIHLWNEMWRRNNTEKSVTHDENCFYEKLKKTYLVPTDATSGKGRRLECGS